MMLLSRDLIDKHDHQGKIYLMITLSGNAQELSDTGLCMALLEPHVNGWGFNVRDLKDRGKCEYYPGETVKRVLMYEKTFPPLYDKKHITFFNQKYTPEVKEEVDNILRKNRITLSPFEL
jgi:hypothetical protein